MVDVSISQKAINDRIIMIGIGLHQKQGVFPTIRIGGSLSDGYRLGQILLPPSCPTAPNRPRDQNQRP
jgi:hypothetical protein